MIRPYQPLDQKKLIQLLQLNTPKYFAPSEEKYFINYLENDSAHYFVHEKNNELLGCGGINYFHKASLARIAWDMVHPNHHGKGIGKQLVEFRINEIKKNNTINKIVVRTSQYTFNFYKKMGFELEKIEKDYWAKGFDLYLMNIKFLKRTLNN